MDLVMLMRLPWILVLAGAEAAAVMKLHWTRAVSADPCAQLSNAPHDV
jgi:hypothetical protein